VLADELAPAGLPADAVQLVATTDPRGPSATCWPCPTGSTSPSPRGGEGLIRRVAAEARMPVLKHYAGNCHVYVDADVDAEIAIRVVVNAKAQRPGVCNAAETLLVHRGVAPSFLPRVAGALAGAGVELRGDEASRELVPSMVPARPSDWDTEFPRQDPGRRRRRLDRRPRWPTSPGTVRGTPTRS